MTSPIFDGRYPPGCNGPPDNNFKCETCGETEEGCPCTQCPMCGETGHADCYLMLAADQRGHGLMMTQTQVELRRETLWSVLTGCAERWLANTGEALAEQEALAQELDQEASKAERRMAARPQAKAA